MSLGRATSLRASLGTLLRRPVAVELAAVVSLLVGVAAYTVAVEAALDPFFLDSDTSLLLVRSALVLAGTGVLTAGYARWRGYSLSVSVPEQGDTRLLAAVAGTVLLATLPFSVLALRTGTGVDHVAATLADPGSVFTVRALIRLSLFVPGMVLLYHGVVQGALRHAFDGDGRLAVAVTTLLGGYLAAPTTVTYGTFAGGPWLSLWGDRAAVAALFVLALGVAVAADRRVDDDRLHALSRLPVLAAVALAALVVAVAADSLGGAVVVVTRAAVIGVAAVAFDAADSLLAPGIVYAAFGVVSSVLYAATVAAAFGG